MTTIQPRTISLNTYKRIIELKYPWTTTDFTFKFNKSREIHVHKELLSLLSPVFEAMFSGHWSESTDVQITDVYIESFQQLMRYFYEGKVELRSRTMDEIAYLAKKYLIDDTILLSECETYMIECFTIETKRVHEFFQWAIYYEFPRLRSECARFIASHTVESIEAFTSLDFGVDILLAILEEIPIDAMKTHRDRIYDFFIRWAMYHCLINNIDANSTSVENVRRQLSKVNDYICCTDSEFIKHYEAIQHKRSIESFRKDVRTQNYFIGIDFEKYRLCPLSERPVTILQLFVKQQVKLLGVRVGSIYRHVETDIDPSRNKSTTFYERIDPSRDMSTAYSGRIRLYHWSEGKKRIASYGFNGYNKHVTFLNGQNEPGVLLNPGQIYELETEVFPPHDELLFQIHRRYTPRGTRFFFYCFEDDEMSFISNLYLGDFKGFPQIVYDNNRGEE